MNIYVDDYNNLGFLCRRWREDKKISVQRIADLCECTRQNVTAFERGEVKSMKVFLSYVAAGFCLLGWKSGTLLACSTKDILDCYATSEITFKDMQFYNSLQLLSEKVEVTTNENSDNK